MKMRRQVAFFLAVWSFGFGCVLQFEEQPSLPVPSLGQGLQSCLSEFKTFPLSELELCLQVEDAICPLVSSLPEACPDGVCNPIEWQGYAGCGDGAGLRGVRFVHPEALDSTLNASLFVTQKGGCVSLFDEASTCFGPVAGSEASSCLMAVDFGYELDSSGILKNAADHGMRLKLSNRLTGLVSSVGTDPKDFCPQLSNREYESARDLVTKILAPKTEGGGIVMTPSPGPEIVPTLCQRESRLCDWNETCATSTTAADLTVESCLSHELESRAVFSYPDLRLDTSFGDALAFTETHLFVGAPSENKVIVFRRVGEGWSEGTVLEEAEGDQFGFSVSVLGDRLLVGSPRSNAAYVYLRDGDTWGLEKRLEGPEGVVLNGNARFGHSVVLFPGGAVVGVPFFISSRFGSKGVAFPFTRTATVWSIELPLIPDEPRFTSFFGESVDIEDDTIVVGASRDSSAGLQSGAAYVFGREGLDWVQRKRLVPSDPINIGFLGERVQIDGDVILASSAKRFDSPRPGEIYIFSRTDTSIVEKTKLLGSTETRDFGTEFFLSDGVLVTMDSDDLFWFVEDDVGWSEVFRLHHRGNFTLGPIAVGLNGDRVVAAGCMDVNRDCETDIYEWSFSTFVSAQLP